MESVTTKKQADSARNYCWLVEYAIRLNRKHEGYCYYEAELSKMRTELATREMSLR